MIMQNTVTSADADWSGMSEDETVTNRNALKPERSRTFLEIVVSYPVFCAYPEYEGKPYYAIKYEEKGETIIGFGTYKPEVLSQYLRQYFLLSAEPEQKNQKTTFNVQVKVDFDYMKALLDDIENLQAYKLFEGDDMVLVNIEDIKGILTKHVKAKEIQLERKKGEWVYNGIRGRFPACKCSICGHYENADWALLQGVNYCPHCGADMRIGDE